MTDGPSLLSGRFRLGELLGTGGSASVFAADDTHAGAGSDPAVALKILHPHLSERPAAREAFLAEARRAEPLRHPNIVGVRGFGVDDTDGAPLVWIALERAAGSSLSEHVARHGPLAPADAVALIDGTLRALEAAHAIGLIHRDVSPANIMVAPAAAAAGALASDGVRLLDFGLADAAGRAALGTEDLLSIESTGRAGVIGNVNYMSPEQVQGMAVDARGDVYQAGAVLYFALTGRPPFSRETTGQTMRAHLTTPPPVPSVTDPRIPRGLDRVVVRAMLKDPADRFASAVAMRAAVADVGIGAARAADATTTTVMDDAPGSGNQITARGVTPTEPELVTRVLGRTVLPPREDGTPASTALAPALAAVPPRPARKRSRSRAGAWFAGTTAALVVGMIVAFAVSASPTASVETQPSETPSSEPLTQPEPEPTTDVQPVVSLLTVPELTRLSLAEADAALADAGLILGSVTTADSASLRDTVLDSSPAAGGRVRAGSRVALVVASGFNAIPDVAGQGRDAAVAILQAAGFPPSFAYRSAPAGTPTGAILGTNPAASTSVTVGWPITIFEAAPAAPTPTFTPAPTPTPNSPTPSTEPTPTPDPEDES
ncbi:PASTA domain-containing protein [Salinibacterium sp. ZJ454]|uniref:protein kinase domain-containing protein n=1 Tax=Salinibacterium sp. ZJ454 TaxID=2708339 RepID=UPI00141ECA33|nr:PASTA domain-containing protein [Salinibacterium sp. ZJ454]